MNFAKHAIRSRISTRVRGQFRNENEKRGTSVAFVAGQGSAKVPFLLKAELIDGEMKRRLFVIGPSGPIEIGTVSSRYGKISRSFGTEKLTAKVWRMACAAAEKMAGVSSPSKEGEVKIRQHRGEIEEKVFEEKITDAASRLAAALGL